MTLRFAMLCYVVLQKKVTNKCWRSGYVRALPIELPALALHLRGCVSVNGALNGTRTRNHGFPIAITDYTIGSLPSG